MPPLHLPSRLARPAALAALLVAILAGPAQAAEVRVLSAGAVQPGLEAVALRFATNGGRLSTAYATGPQMLAKVAAGEAADVLIVPEGDVAAVAAATGAAAATIGRVGMGLAVRRGAPAPDISTVAALCRAVLAAKAVIYNRASTGAYVEGLLQRLGLAQVVAGRTERPVDAQAAMARLASGTGPEIAFGALTAIALAHEKGVVLAGPLPGEVQSYTSYAVLMAPGSAARPEVAAFYALLTGPEGHALMAANGVE